MNYPKYKSSGIEWLPEVPESWTVGALRQFTDYTTGWTPSTENAESFEGANLWANISDLGPRRLNRAVKRISDLAVSERGARPSPRGSLLFSFKLSVGTVSIAEVEMFTNEAIATFVDTDGLVVSYGFYALPLFVLQNASTNIYGAKMLNQQLIRSAALALPPPTEQKQIADFLDRETAQIDDLIAEQEALAKNLAERRKAVISHAVTKGLNPDAELKDSGIEWATQIPAGWRVDRISHLFRVISSGTTPENADLLGKDEGHVCWVTTGELRENYITSTRQTVAAPTVAETSALKVYSPGTLLIAMYGATIGRLGILGVPACTNQACCAMSEPFGVETRFVFYAFQGALDHIMVLASGGGQPNINQEKVRSLRIPVPSLEEQREIIGYLDDRTAKTGALILEAEALIALLKERRSALISAAVTGKIDVRQEALARG